MEEIKERFEDLEDMMDHAHEKLIDAVYHFCLCVKVNLPGVDESVVKTLLQDFIAEEFDDLWPRLIPYLDITGPQAVIYGLIVKDKN